MELEKQNPRSFSLTCTTFDNSAKSDFVQSSICNNDLLALIPLIAEEDVQMDTTLRKVVKQTFSTFRGDHFLGEELQDLHICCNLPDEEQRPSFLPLRSLFNSRGMVVFYSPCLPQELNWGLFLLQELIWAFNHQPHAHTVR